MQSEQLRGDPPGEFTASPESLTLTDEQSRAIDEIVAPENLEEVAPAAQKDAKTLFTQFVLNAAGKEADAHISRATNKPRVTEYLALFGLDFADAAGIPYAFCAAGLGWVACEGYCQMQPTIAFGDPPTSVFRRVVPTLNQFYWSGGADAEHVGIVESASATTLRTVEFNTSVVVDGNQRNGGVVARKNRDDARRFVIGYVATHSRPSA
jgi:hypothetical protein